MATSGYSSTNYHSVSDHADFTLPNGDWFELLIVRPDDVSGGEDIITNGDYEASNSRFYYIFDNDFGLKTNSVADQNAANATTGNWFLLCGQRSGTTLTLRSVPMGNTTVTASGGATLNAAVNSANPNYIGRSQANGDNPFNGAISDWLLVPGQTISDADLQAIATGTAIDSFAWYSSAIFWAILQNSTNTDHIGGKTITENGSLSTATDSPDLLRFGGTTINGSPGAIALAGVGGEIVTGRTIDGSVGELALAGVTGQASAGRTITGMPGVLALAGVAGEVVSVIGASIDGTPGVMALAGVSGQVSLDRSINGSPGVMSLQGVTGDLEYGYIFDATPGAMGLQGVSGQIVLEVSINGLPGVMALQGVTGSAVQILPPPSPTTIGGSNIYFIGKNLFDAATLIVTSTASGFDKDNLKLEKKSKVWRSTSLSAQTIIATWGSGQDLSGLGLAFTNLMYGSTVRVKLYTNAADGSPVYDSGTLYVDFAYDAPTGFSTIGLDAFSFGGGSYFSHLFTTETCEKMELVITSVDNPDGYIEVSRVITGFAFTPTIGASYGAQIGHDDASTLALTDSGDVIANRGTMGKSMTLTLGVLNPIDRQGLVNLIRTRGIANPIFASIYENSTNVEERQSYLIYGRFDSLPSTNIFEMDMYNSTMTLREI